jgi:hypothetical protein
LSNRRVALRHGPVREGAIADAGASGGTRPPSFGEGDPGYAVMACLCGDTFAEVAGPSPVSGRQISTMIAAARKQGDTGRTTKPLLRTRSAA